MHNKPAYELTETIKCWLDHVMLRTFSRTLPQHSLHSICLINTAVRFIKRLPNERSSWLIIGNNEEKNSYEITTA